MEFFMLSNRDILKKILRRIREASYVEPEDIPSIELYMDQVTTFMDEHLKNNKRHPSDKALTKTMINNYTKNRLLPAPVKKKYSKEHMLLLLFIYYFKNLLTFSDIENIFKPITNLHFSNKEKSGIDLEDIYKEIIRLNKPDVYELQKDIIRKFKKAGKSFEGADKEQREQLILFAFICDLAFDVYMKKQIIEQISDYLAELD
jgi:hypothetical protein